MARATQQLWRVHVYKILAPWGAGQEVHPTERSNLCPNPFHIL